MKKRRFVVSLALAHLLLGPPCAGLLFVAALWMSGAGGQSSLDLVGVILNAPRLLVSYVPITPAFYIPGALPALTTGMLTALRVWKTGRCSWVWASTCGAVASVMLVGLPSLLFIDGITKSWRIGYPAAFLLMLAFQATLGFVGTIPVWIATGFLRRRLAAERPAAIVTPAAET
jgi:hypothetical protein